LTEYIVSTNLFRLAFPIQVNAPYRWASSGPESGPSAWKVGTNSVRWNKEEGRRNKEDKFFPCSMKL
jgi:hypothetical protein